MKTNALLLVIVTAVSFAAFTAGADNVGRQTGRVYVLSNRHCNSVLVYDRAPDGNLTFLQEAMSNGSGTGVTLDPLQSQGSLALNGDGPILLAVNPASG